jgi:hypothetical protein
MTLAAPEARRLAPPSGGVFTLRGTARKRASSSGEDVAAALTG